MKNTTVFVGKGWIDVPEAKLQSNDEITGWAVKRDIWFFAFYAQVQIKIEATLANVSLTNFTVTGTEANVQHFKRIVERAVNLHNSPRFANMKVPVVTWHMKISCAAGEPKKSK
jgi:hypothetical protein